MFVKFDVGKPAFDGGWRKWSRGEARLCAAAIGLRISPSFVTSERRANHEYKYSIKRRIQKTNYQASCSFKEPVVFSFQKVGGDDSSKVLTLFIIRLSYGNVHVFPPRNPMASLSGVLHLTFVLLFTHFWRCTSKLCSFSLWRPVWLVTNTNQQPNAVRALTGTHRQPLACSSKISIACNRSLIHPPQQSNLITSRTAEKQNNSPPRSIQCCS
jgi:hypothetical protein